MTDNNDDLVVDALDSGVVENYDRLISEFGIKPISDVIDLIPEDQRHMFISRDIMFGHTDLERVLDAVNNKRPFAVMTGIKPSGRYHIGSLSTVSEVIYFQKLGGRVSFAIADIESYVANGMPFDKAAELAIDNVADLFAMGLDTNPENTYIYSQSKQFETLKFGHIFASQVTLNTLKSIYGEKLRIGYYNAALIQVADILLPQIRWGSMPTITPIGADQAPHARLTRDIARKEIYQEEFGFQLPSFTYHRLLGGIDGGPKMSKSIPMSYFDFAEDYKSIEKKINNALTGGRDTAKEQREKGGTPEKCRVMDLFIFMFEKSDEALEDRKQRCKSGELLCGPCKNDLKNEIEIFQINHNELKSTMIELATETVMKQS